MGALFFTESDCVRRVRLNFLADKRTIIEIYLCDYGGKP